MTAALHVVTSNRGMACVWVAPIASVPYFLLYSVADTLGSVAMMAEPGVSLHVVAAALYFLSYLALAVGLAGVLTATFQR